MIGDGHPLVVWQQWIVRAEQLSDVCGVVNGSEEIRVVPNLGGNRKLNTTLRNEAGKRSGLL